MLKQKKDGTWTIQSGADLEEAVAAIEEREQAVRDLEAEMEEKYDYLTMKQEAADLIEAVRVFMVSANMKHVFRDTYKLTLIRRATTKWNPDKLKNLVGKATWLKITDQVVSPSKIDDLTREGKLDSKLIAPALEQTPTKPFIQRFPYKDGQDKDAAMDEETALRAAMSGEAVAGSAGGSKKRGKK